MRHDTVPTIPPEMEAVAPTPRHPLRLALHDQGWSLDIEKKRDELTMLAYRTVFIPQREKTVMYSLNIDTNADPVTLLLTRLTVDTKTSAYDFAVLNPLLMREFIRGTLQTGISVMRTDHVTDYDLNCITKIVLDKCDDDIVIARKFWLDVWRDIHTFATGCASSAVFADTVIKLLSSFHVAEGTK